MHHLSKFLSEALTAANLPKGTAQDDCGSILMFCFVYHILKIYIASRKWVGLHFAFTFLNLKLKTSSERKCPCVLSSSLFYVSDLTCCYVLFSVHIICLY